MLRKFQTLALLTPIFCLAACASGPQVDMKRFSEARTLLNNLPEAPSCSVIPSTLHKLSLPPDTSGGVFGNLKDVIEQDAAISAHYPIAADRFKTLSRTVKENEKTDAENSTDYLKAIEDVKSILDGVIEEEEKGSWWNPFD